MKTTRLSVIVSLLLIAFSSSVMAHSLWINSFESHAHKPGHAMISLGWGHALPMDDILTSPNGRIAIERFELIDPDFQKTDLIKPGSKLSKPALTTNNFDLFAADLATQKITLNKDSTKGVYQISAISKSAFFTQFIDRKGKTRLKLKPKNEIKNIKKVLMCVKYQAFAKSYLTVDKWINPKPLGHGLEIISRTDMSNLHVGDLVEVDVVFYGKPLNATAKSIEYITAHSSSFGQSDGFSLMSYIKDGKAQFRVQSSGQWVINVSHKDDVTKDGPLKNLYGKAEQVFHGASLTFNVK